MEFNGYLMGFHGGLRGSNDDFHGGLTSGKHTKKRWKITFFDG